MCQKRDRLQIMAQNLRRIEPLVFDDDIANNWLKFKKEWDVYSKAGLSDKSKKVQAYTFLNVAGSVTLPVNAG